jgi:hypothetical protein
MMRGMVIDMNDEQLHTLAELQAFLDGTVAVDFAMADEARYDCIARTVRRFGYGRLKRAEKGVERRFLERGAAIRASNSPGWSNGAVSDADSPSATEPHAPALRVHTRVLMCSCSPIPIPCTARCRAWLPRS